MNNYIKIFDTTLRDGEQSPGISLGIGEKIEIAKQLKLLGVDIIEAGFPASSVGEFESVKNIAHQVQGATIAALSRTSLSDIDKTWDALRAAESPRIHVFIATSKLHMQKKLRMSEKEVAEATARGVSRAALFVSDVEFSPEDACRSDIDFMCKICQIAVDSGATTLNIPDTVGYTVPNEYGRLIKHVASTVKGEYTLSTHCHNDLGLAVANSLAGVENGARQIECAINGLGERAGNAALEEVVMALTVRNEYFNNLSTGINTRELLKTSRIVSQLTGYSVQFNKAVVGRNAFSHESGIHQHGVLQDSLTYEIIKAADVGQVPSKIILGKHSGRHAFLDTLNRLKFSLSAEQSNSAFIRFKTLADKKCDITDDDIEAIVTEEVGRNTVSINADNSIVLERFSLDYLSLKGSTDLSQPATASVVLLSPNQPNLEATSTGDGMIDAALNAVSKASGVNGKIVDFQVNSVTGGSEALGAVVIIAIIQGHKVMGRAIAPDVAEAAARAYINAINKVVHIISPTSLDSTT